MAYAFTHVRSTWVTILTRRAPKEQPAFFTPPTWRVPGNPWKRRNIKVHYKKSGQSSEPVPFSRSATLLFVTKIPAIRLNWIRWKQKTCMSPQLIWLATDRDLQGNHKLLISYEADRSRKVCIEKPSSILDIHLRTIMKGFRKRLFSQNYD